MEDFLTNIGKLFAVALGFLGISKIVISPLSRRVKALEDAPVKREATECTRLQAACPVAIRLIAVEKATDGFTAWLIRIEKKLDDVIKERK